MPRDQHNDALPLPTAELQRLAADVLRAAREGGATAAETDVSQAIGLSVTVRKDEVETIAYNRDKGIGVTVYVGQRRGTRSTADFSADALRATVEKALTIARYTADDPCAGLADPERLARTIPDLDLYHPWTLSVEEAIELGRTTEAAALAVDPRITNSEGASVSRSEAEFVYANTLGFSGGYKSSRHHIDCSVIGEHDDAMQRDYWYTAARARRRTCCRRRKSGGSPACAPRGGSNARSLDTIECPVLFEAPEAVDLIGAFVGAVSGGALYRKSTFLPDSLGKAIFAPLVAIREEPHLPRERGARRSTTKAWQRCRETSCRTASSRATSSAAIRRASSA
jgi:PmbA protein